MSDKKRKATRRRWESWCLVRNGCWEVFGGSRAWLLREHWKPGDEIIKVTITEGWKG